MANTDHLWLGGDWEENSPEPINFIETRLMDLSPFSAHEVELDGITYKTAEHAYQALRVIPEARAKIQATTSPMNAWRAGQKCKEHDEMLPNHDKDELMERIFRAKLEQHNDVKAVLRITSNRELLKVYDSDYYWGTGADGSGENKMGKLWMKLRAELK
ncbi:NADAR family protein [Candidatus Kaiserbacteria bacterium]|nr:NADAR family protein [Candidatus Kaiserbacteria bacterium]